MPIYTPSYFPPARANGSIVGATAGVNTVGARNILAGLRAGIDTVDSDLIVIGDGALGAGCDSEAITGLIAIGSSACGSMDDSAPEAQTCTVIGYHAAALAPSMRANTFLGSLVFSTVESTTANTANVIIGEEAAANIGPSTEQTIENNVIIGTRAMRGEAAESDISVENTVIIGAQINLLIGGESNVSASVIIGANVSTLGGCAQSVLIGRNVQSDAGAQCFRNIVIGNSSTVGPGESNILIGALITGITGTANVFIGEAAGVSQDGDAQLLFEINVDEPLALIYGDFLTGNVVLGNSAAAVNRDFGGAGATNILKLLNGTIGDTNPVGGGYFYISAGALHWVGSAGTDTVVAPA
jgi:serine acetyltransferase